MDDTTANFTKAIDKYYSTHPSCVLPEPTQFPLQTDSSDLKEISKYDALVDEGLLVRATEQKQAVSAPGRQVTTYDLSAKGHAAWVADSQQAGFGNLCYGHRKVTSVDSSTPTSSQNGAKTDVVYRYSITDAPDWAKASVTQIAFPALRADLSGSQVGRATLTDTHKGWQVTSAPWAHISDSDIYK